MRRAEPSPCWGGRGVWGRPFPHNKHVKCCSSHGGMDRGAGHRPDGVQGRRAAILHSSVPPVLLLLTPPGVGGTEQRHSRRSAPLIASLLRS